MFTGIIEATARVLSKESGKIAIERPKGFQDLKRGSSIAISGACLSVSEMDEKTLAFDVMPETIAKTTLSDLKPGNLVNLERALPAHGRFEGHVVQGHVEGVGEITEVLKEGADARMSIRVSEDLRRHIAPKGSVAVDGVSMTVSGAGQDSFSIAMIPMTLRDTTLGGKRVGDRVNIETDILVRTLLALE